MSRIPGFLLRKGHEVTVEPYQGESSHGTLYGNAETVRCLRDDKRRLVRTPTGDQVVSDLTLYAQTGTVIPPESRITLPTGRTATVIDSYDRSGGGLPTPDHVEVICR